MKSSMTAPSMGQMYISNKAESLFMKKAKCIFKTIAVLTKNLFTKETQVFMNRFELAKMLRSGVTFKNEQGDVLFFDSANIEFASKANNPLNSTKFSLNDWLRTPLIIVPMSIEDCLNAH